MAIQFEHTIEVTQKPEQVFAVLADITKTPLWLARCTGIEQQSGGPLQVGSKLKYSYKEPGQSGVMDGEVVTLQENSNLAFRYWDSMMEVSVRFAMKPSGRGTSLTHSIEITPKTLIAKMMSPLIRSRMPKQTITAMNALASLLARN